MNFIVEYNVYLKDKKSQMETLTFCLQNSGNAQIEDLQIEY